LLRLQSDVGESPHRLAVGLAGLGKLLPAFTRRRLDAHCRIARPVGEQSLGPHLALEIVDLEVPGQHPVLLGVGGIEPDAVPVHQVTCLGDEAGARRQLAPPRHRLVDRPRRPGSTQPFGQHGLERRIVALDPRGQRLQPLDRLGGEGRHDPRREEGHLGRRCITREPRKRIQPFHLQRADAFAQQRLDGRLPAMLDAQPLPQAGEPFKSMPLQPGIDAALGLDPLLELPQRRDPGLDLCQSSLGLAQRLLRGRSSTVRITPGVVGGREALGRRLFGDLRSLQAQCHRLGGGIIGGVDLRRFRLQTVLAAFGLDPRLLGGATPDSRQFDLLARRQRLAAGRIDLFAHSSDPGFDLGQFVREHRDPLGERLGAQGRVGQAVLSLEHTLPRVIAFRRPSIRLRAERLPPRLQLGLGIDHEADLGFEPGHLGVGLVEAALHSMNLVTGRRLLLAHLLEFELDRAEIGDMRLERVGGLPGLAAIRACSASASSRRTIHSICCARSRSASRRRNCCATSACFSSLSICAPSSRRMSSTRVRFSRVSASRFSVSRRRSLYLETPAASSRNTRISSGLASMMREIMP
jgi:hypothetical protein